MGKTRLALRYAELRGSPFLATGGTWFCDLSEAHDASDLCAVLARALGLRLAAQVDLATRIDELADVIARAGSPLLVLDNFEQVAQLLASEAVALFEERARAAGGWNDADPALAGEVAALVRALDGIPLAIELAAARSRVLAPSELRRRLADRSGVLLGGARELSSRHATLRAAIDWSRSMLGEPERAALVQCSIFAG